MFVNIVIIYFNRYPSR